MTRLTLPVFLAAFILLGPADVRLRNSGSSMHTRVPHPQTGLEVGHMAPELAYENPDGDTIALSSLKGKVVLIHFWVSTCFPCRRENEGLVSCYREFKDKSFTRGEGFTIYSLSCDGSRSEWMQAIEEDSLIWENHVSDLKGWESEGPKIYNVYTIPSNFLVDKEGVIMARDLSSHELTQMLQSIQKD